MSSISLIVISLGCLIFLALVVVLAWEFSRSRTGRNPVYSPIGAENQDASLPEDAPTTTIRKYKPYLLSPIGLAFLLYLISFIPLLIIPALEVEFGMVFLFAIIIAFTGFSVISPIINLFLPRWWLNTVLYIISWFLLFYALIGTLSWRAGEDMSIAAIGFGPAMMAAFFVLPVTVVVKLFMFFSSKSQDGLPSQQ